MTGEEEGVLCGVGDDGVHHGAGHHVAGLEDRVLGIVGEHPGLVTLLGHEEDDRGTVIRGKISFPCIPASVCF